MENEIPDYYDMVIRYHEIAGGIHTHKRAEKPADTPIDDSYYDMVIRYHELTSQLLEIQYPELRGNGQNYIKDEKGRFAGSRPGGGSGSASGKTYRINSGVTVETDYTANRELIDSFDYILKFDNISDNPLMMWKLANTARRCIYENDGTQNETTIVLTKFAGKIVSESRGKYAGGSKANCDIYIPEGKTNSLILIHNHGNSSPFSFGDFVTLNNCPEVKTMIAAGHNGTVFKMSVGKGKRLDFLDTRVYNDYENMFARAYNPKTGDLTALTNICKDLGWRFEYE